MQTYDVVIIGGGVSGLSCAITLGSAAAKIESTKAKRYLVVDAGKSHLNMAEVHNVPGIAPGTPGPALLQSLAEQAKGYANVEIKADTVLSVEGTIGSFSLETASGEKLRAELVVFANGMQTIEVEGIGAQVINHVRAPRPGMVMIENRDGKVGAGKYVTGCAGGASSMFASAAGSGAQTATDILSFWAGKYVVVHDVLKKS